MDDQKLRPGRKLFAALFVTMSVTVTVSSASDTKDTLPFKPGLWETTTTIKSDTPGIPSKPQTTKECFTEDLLDSEKIARQMEEGMPGGSCEVTQTVDGSVLNMVMSCKAPEGSMTGLGSYTVSDDGKSMQGSANMEMMLGGFTASMQMQVTGQYVGEC